MTECVLLLAGSSGPERTPARPDPQDNDWFLPLHLREPGSARERVARQVEVGADVVVAPTWLTHRRALLPVGETRRAGDWSAAAVRLAREAVEIGLERRAEALAEVPAHDPRRDRPAPLVAASLPSLDDDPVPESGRLLPHEAASQRDYREQAGWLADAQPDLLLVEGQRTEASARVAVTEAVETGLPVWVALTPAATTASGIERWLDWCPAAGVARLLLPPPLASRLAAASGPLPWGAHDVEAGAVDEWLDAGAGAVARTDEATATTLELLRSAIDEHERVTIETRFAQRQRWRALVERAAAMAPGGAAVCLGPREATLPGGFEWVRVDDAELPRLPAERYRLVLAATGMADAARARILQRGGILVAQPGHAAQLRLVALDDVAEPPLAIYRRED